MATYWWVNDDADNDQANANNWAASEGGAGGAGVPGAGDGALCSATSSGDSIVLTANWSIGSFNSSAAASGGSDNWTGDLSLGTYDMVTTGQFDMGGASGDHSILGADNAGCTLSTGVFRLRAYADLFSNSDFTLTCSSFLTLTNAGFAGSGKTLGNLVIDGDGSWRNDSGWWPETITFNAGTTTTLAGLGVSSQVIGWTNTTDVTVNGTIVFASGKTIQMLTSSGTLTLGANCDIVGDATNIWYLRGSSYSIAKTSAFSHAGGIIIDHWNTSGQEAPVADFSNANYTLQSDQSDPGRVLTFMAGTLKCVRLAVNSVDAGDDIEVDASVNNPDFEVSGVMDMDQGAGSIVWTKGTGTLSLVGSSGTQQIDFGGLSFEDIILKCAGATKNASDIVTTDSLSGSGGTLQSSAGGTERVFTATNTGVMASCTIEDIHMNAANKVNAKDGCTNNGNTKGIVFNDTLRTN